MGIRPKTNIEAILGRLGGRIFDDPDRRANPGPAEISDEDRERMVAYVEGRMGGAEARRFRRRLSAEPALREALADFLVDIRDTDYGKSLLAGGVNAVAGIKVDIHREEVEASAPGVFARFLDGIAEAFSPRRPVFAAAYALAAVLFVGGVVWWYGAVIRPTSQARAVLAQAELEVRQGELTVARNRLATVLQSPATPESLRLRAGGLLESATVAESAELTRRGDFPRAIAALDQALAVQPDRPILLAQAADVRLRALRVAEGRSPELDLAESPRYRTKGLTFEPSGKQAELDRILSLYRRATEVALIAPATASTQANRDAIVLRSLIGQSQVHIEKGDLAAASDALGRARTLAPNSPGVQNALGRLFLEKGRSDLARDAFEQSIRLDPAPTNPARWDLNKLFGPVTPDQRRTPQSLPQPTPSGSSQPTPTPIEKNESERSALDSLFNR